MIDGKMYDADYFLHGRQSGKSLYVDYTWKPDLTIPMVCAIVRHLGIRNHNTVCDFGCARGYTVKAFRQLDFEAFGVDLSEWAIANCDPDVADYVRCGAEIPSDLKVDWVLAKDVLEHVAGVRDCVARLMNAARIGVFAVVPLSLVDAGEYVVTDYELDVTHLHRFTLQTWADMFLRPGWSVEMAYRVPGVKDNYSQWECGNGFITARRIK